MLKRAAVGALALVVAAATGLVIAWYAFPFPLERLTNLPASSRVTSREGATLLELTGADGQWRFPVPLSRIPAHLVQATIAVEDKRFRSHRGVDGLAVLRAAGQDLRAMRTVSGASTLTMQVCRMMDDRPRTLSAKLVESFRALQLEAIWSKDQVLEAYLNMAPYGRNLRGAQAGSIAYFGKNAGDLSLGEAALLAGLPQSPGRYRPDLHPDAAKSRREAVLRRMRELGMISRDQELQAGGEPLVIAPNQPHRPVAFHAAQLALSRRPGGGRTTIDARVQTEVERLASQHVASLPPRTEVSAVVIEIATGDIVAMLGSTNPADPVSGQVNGAIAWRSPGSALKPFVYAAAFEARRLGPDSVVYDVPIHRAGWSPQNFDKAFHGPMPAADALRRSLNAPAILVAEAVGLDRCTGLIESAGVRFAAPPQPHGGLAVVTGAVEVRLLDLVNAYATIGRRGVRQAVRLFGDEPPDAVSVLDPEVCAAIDAILGSRSRPVSGMEELGADRKPWFMWKTGTSSGRRDAVAVGHNRRYAVGVWAGRFSGSPSPELVGSQAAEPLLARIFALPQIRNDADPPAPRPWAVPRPLPRPAELVQAPRITYPAAGATFLTVNGQAVIRTQVNRTAGLNWFLNGSLITPQTGERLVLAPGTYELRCADDRGQSDAVNFVVR